MKIVLDGVETNNKGAELMFYAILQEIERKFPKATIYINASRVKQGFSYLKTSLTIKEKPVTVFERWCIKLHLWRVMKKLLGKDIYKDIHWVPGSSYYLDDSGFFYSDQWNLPRYYVDQRGTLLKSNKRWGCKNIFLPQAFGPIMQENTKKGILDLDKYADLVMPRENVSYQYLLNSGLISQSKLKMFPDFTCLVKGEVPEGFKHLNRGVCIIPNVRMLDKSDLTFEVYNDFIQSVIKTSIDKGFTPYLLNHEGKDDGNLALKFQAASSIPIEVVDGLNALEVKGVISTAHLVITSRFHGVASSLNSCVPCLATSWSHKYEELFKDYEQTDCVLSMTNLDTTVHKIKEYLDKNNNNSIRERLKALLPSKIEKSKEMWKEVWKI